MNEVVISVRNLTKCFGNFTAVNNISLDVLRGEIFGSLGANGPENPLQCVCCVD